MATQDNVVTSTITKGRLKFNNLRTKHGSMSFKVFGAISDQALFAGSNFFINLLLARWMPKEEFGAVVVAFTWFLLVQTFYEALLVSPMSYYGADKYQSIFRRYLGYIFTGHALLSIAIAVIFGIIALLINEFNSVLLGQAMAGVAVATVFLLARGMIRQPFYVLSKPHYSALGGGIYLVVNVAVTALLYASNLLTPFSALVGMGAASFAAIVVQIFLLKPKFRGKSEHISTRSVIEDHWRHGKWAISARAISWLSTNFGMLIIPLVTGFSSSATLKAITNLTMPIFMTSTAMVALLTPIFVRTYKAEGATGLDKKVRNFNYVAMFVTGTYFLVLSIFGKQIISLIYDGRYDSEVSTIYIMAIAAIPFITTISRILDSALVGMGKIKLSFKSKVVPTMLTVFLDILFVIPFGILGLAIESLITASMTQYNVYRYYKKKLAEDAEVSKAEATAAQVNTEMQEIPVT